MGHAGVRITESLAARSSQGHTVLMRIYSEGRDHTACNIVEWVDYILYIYAGIAMGLGGLVLVLVLEAH